MAGTSFSQTTFLKQKSTGTGFVSQMTVSNQQTCMAMGNKALGKSGPCFPFFLFSPFMCGGAGSEVIASHAH